MIVIVLSVVFSLLFDTHQTSNGQLFNIYPTAPAVIYVRIMNTYYFMFAQDGEFQKPLAIDRIV